MKKITFLFFFVLFCSGQVFGQLNPIENLTWQQSYSNLYNHFALYWDEPTQPHDSLIGYNVYRENDLYRFQTTNELYFNYPNDNNCPGSFLSYNGLFTFWVHVTAVYEGQIESTYIDSVQITEPAIGVQEIKPRKEIVPYPNPTNGKLYIPHTEIQEIVVFDLSGKLVKEFEPAPEIALAQFPKGIYFVKLISEKKTVMNKIVLE